MKKDITAQFAAQDTFKSKKQKSVTGDAGLYSKNEQGGEVEMKLYVQETMDGLPKPDKQGYASIAEMMRDAECPIDKKLKFIGQIRGFVTVNGVTKEDLHEMLKVTYDLLKTRVGMKY